LKKENERLVASTAIPSTGATLTGRGDTSSGKDLTEANLRRMAAQADNEEAA